MTAKQPAVSPFSDEHEQLRDAVRRLVAREILPRIEEWEGRDVVPARVFRKLGELGWLGLSVPTAAGGEGADLWAAVLVAEELARAGSLSLVWAISMHADGTLPLLASASPTQQEQWLRPGLRGQTIAVVDLFSTSESKPVQARVRASRQGGDWVLDGTVGATSRHQSVVLVPAETEGDRAVFVVDAQPFPHRHAAEPGQESEPAPEAADLVGLRGAARADLRLDHVRIPDHRRLDGVTVAQLHLARERVELVLAAAVVAGAELAFDRSLAYARQREAFGRPIAGFQVLRHRLVDMATAVETWRRRVYDICAQWQDRVDGRPDTARVLRGAARAAFGVQDAALQIHAGAGYLRGHAIERLWRDTRQLLEVT